MTLRTLAGCIPAAIILWGLLGQSLAAEPGPAKKVAIFAKNRAAEQYNDRIPVLEDLIVAQFTDLGLSIISREDAIQAVSTATGKVTELDAQLDDNTSALRLANDLGADYVFSVSLLTYGENIKSFKGYGVERKNREAKLRLTYKILDRAAGGSLVSDAVEVTAQTAASENATEAPDMLNDLLSEAATKLAEKFSARIKAKGGSVIAEPPPAPVLISFSVACSLKDLMVPAVMKSPTGEYVIGASTYDVQALDVTVELNGTAIGTAPGTFKAPKGLSKLRLTREGCKPWERVVNLVDGQTFKVAIEMDEAGYARWKETTTFFEVLKAGQKLTDAQVKVMEGVAQMFSQSGFKVDIKSDSKVNIDSDLKGVVQNSLWNKDDKKE